MSILSRSLLFLCLLTSSLFANVQNPTAIKVGEMNVDVWLADDTPANDKVVIFSHGFHGSNRQSGFLLRALAEAGYNVFAPDHRDVAAFKKPWRWFESSAMDFHQPEKWSDNTYRDRAQDIATVIQTLSQDSRYQHLDWKHITLAGHSLGGYTVLGLAGAWPDWQKYQIQPIAVLALSPYLRPYLEKKTLGNISIPILYQGGTKDEDITPYLIKPNGGLDQTTAPHLYVEFNGATHFSWTLLKPGYHNEMNQYVIAFLNHVIKHQPIPSSLLKKGEKVSEVKASRIPMK